MPDYHDDFREVAHSGGQVTFTIETDQEGRRMYQVSYSGSNPNPMSLFAVYALPQGVACGDIQLGGIGEPWNPPPLADSSLFSWHRIPRAGSGMSARPVASIGGPRRLPLVGR